MSRPKRLPGDARVADLAHANLMKEQRGRGPSPKTMSEAELQAHMRASLNVPNPPDKSHTLATELEGLIQLRITDVMPYDRNPRQHENERYSDIKESIRVASVLAPIVVTRRPGNSRHMVAAGGNTRLKAQQELWSETGDARFEYLLGIYRPWNSELSTMVAHMAENELRGGLSFWDRANGIWALKREIEAEAGETLSLRKLHDELAKRGLKVSIGLLSAFGFAVEHLADLSAATVRLTKNAAQELQPAFNQLELYLKLHRQEAEWPLLRAMVLKTQAHVLAEEAFTDDLIEGVRRINPLDPELLVAVLQHAVAAHLGQTAAEVRTMCDAIKRHPKASLEELRRHLDAPADALPPAAPAASTTRILPPSSAPVSTNTTAAASPPCDSHGVGTAHEAIRTGTGAVEPSTVTPAATVPSSSPHTAEAGPTPDDEPAEAAIITFVRACGVADLFRQCRALPHGYFMEVPPDGMFIDGFGDGEVEPLRHGGWWIAAMYSGQIDGALSHLMPKDSLWRQLQRMENGHDDTALQWHIETTLGNPPGLLELGQWLLRCPDHVIDAHERLVRELRRSVVQ